MTLSYMINSIYISLLIKLNFFDSFDFIVNNTLNNWKTLEIGKAVSKKTNFKGNFIEGYKENEYNCATAWKF